MVKYCPSCSFDLSSIMVKTDEPKKKTVINRKVSIINQEVPIEVPEEIQDEDQDLVNNIIDKLVIKKKSRIQTDHLKKMRDAKAKKALERKEAQAQAPTDLAVHDKSHHNVHQNKPTENHVSSFKPLFNLF